MPHDRLRIAWIAPPRGARLPRRRHAPGTTTRKEKGAGVNASPSLITLDSGAQAPPIQKRR
jgi:hypothetical protein